MKALIQKFWREEEGLQTVEIVLILVVSISLVAILRTYASSWMRIVSEYVQSWVVVNT